MTAAEDTSADAADIRNNRYDVIDLWRLPMDFFELPLEAQFQAIANVTRPATKLKQPRSPCKMSVLQQVQFGLFSFATLGLPLLAVPITGVLLFFRSSFLKYWFTAMALLALHPIPPYKLSYRRHWIGLVLCRYFTMEVVIDRCNPLQKYWGTSAVDEAGKRAEEPVLPLACPHGVLNFGAIIWVFFSRWISGHDQYTAGASAVQWVPGLRHLMAAIWVINADRKSLKRRLQEKPNGSRRGGVVGIVPDGIQGIFHSTPGEDVLHLGPKRGLLRIACEEGALLAGGWFPGTTDAFTVIQDPLGIMKWISRRLQVSLFLFYGRWGLPIPRRSPTAICVYPVRAPKLEDPSEETLEKLHQEVYGGLARTFDEQKDFVGYIGRSLVIT